MKGLCMTILLLLPLAAAADEGLELPTLPTPVAKVVGNLTPMAEITVRYDNIWTTDPTDLFFVPAEDVAAGQNAEIPKAGEYLDGFRTKVRFGMTYDHEGALVAGGVRVAVGENPNPASSFVALGDAFRVTNIGLDQYWIQVRPLKDREGLAIELDLGKMPNPFWRGKARSSGFASEMIWDVDVNPAGAAGTAILPVGDAFRIENTAAYWVIQDNEDRRFAGLTGEVNIIADQVRVLSKHASAALAFYAFENVNSGLRAPGITGPGNALVDPGSNAFLFNSGIQATNNRVTYGPGAVGFMQERFRMVNLTVQIHPELELAGFPVTPHLLVDAVLNMESRRGNRGVGLTGGVVVGGFEEGMKLHPVDVWFTYRNVEADATLSVFADSDLGRGTEYEGIEVAASYAVSKKLKVAAAFFDFDRWPARQIHDRRLFFDVSAKF